MDDNVRCGQLRSESDHAGKRRRPRPYVNEEFTITNDFFTALPVPTLSARLAVSLRPLNSGCGCCQEHGVAGISQERIMVGHLETRI